MSELWDYRELIFFLAWRDVTVRYKQTLLGVAWAVLQPLLTAIVFSVFFGRLANVQSDGLPYPVFALAALVPWQLFAFSLGQVSNSLVSDQGLLRKVYFPRLALPLSSLVTALPDFVVSYCVLLASMALYGIPLGWRSVVAPLFAVLALLVALSVGVWFAALNVKYRDFRYTVPFLIQIWLFASPVVYSSSIVPARWRLLYGLNPMTGVIDGFRWALLGAPPPGAPAAFSFGVVVLLLLGGLVYFHRVESTFADVV